MAAKPLSKDDFDLGQEVFYNQQKELNFLHKPVFYLQITEEPKSEPEEQEEAEAVSGESNDNTIIDNSDMQASQENQDFDTISNKK